MSNRCWVFWNMIISITIYERLGMCHSIKIFLFFLLFMHSSIKLNVGWIFWSIIYTEYFERFSFRVKSLIVFNHFWDASSFPKRFSRMNETYTKFEYTFQHYSHSKIIIIPYSIHSNIQSFFMKRRDTKSEW